MKKKLIGLLVLFLTLAAVVGIVVWAGTADQLLLCRVEGPKTVTCWASVEGGDIRAVSRAIKESMGPVGEIPENFETSLPGYTVEGWDGPDTWAVWSGGWLMDQDGRYYPCAPDWDALTSRLETGKLPIRHRAELAAMTGAWSPELLAPADGGPVDHVTAVISEIRGSELWLQITGDSVQPVRLPQPELDVLLGDTWYRLPRGYEPDQAVAMTSAVAKGQLLTPVVNIDLICARYPILPAGKYRIWAYGATYEFIRE